MDNNELYVTRSLELHLFFARIMKEHSLFLKAAFTPVDTSFAKESEFFKQEFENLLCTVVNLSDGFVSQDVLSSGEIITEFTACAEKQTQQFTGISINENITKKQAHLHCDKNTSINTNIHRQVKMLNLTALRLLDGLIALKERILKNVLSCKMFTMNYPLLLEHIIREARLYRMYVLNYENGLNFDCQSMAQIEQFWNQIMMEHAQFIRGLLDPSENELIETSDCFAENYARLLNNCCEAQDRIISTKSNASLEETLKFRKFKTAGAKGIQECKIRSIILPLLADHVLREANHYIRLLDD